MHVGLFFLTGPSLEMNFQIYVASQTFLYGVTFIISTFLSNT